MPPPSLPWLSPTADATPPYHRIITDPQPHLGTAFVSKGDNEVPFEFKIEEGGSLLGVKLQMASTTAFEGMQIVHLEISDLVKLFLGCEERLTSQDPADITPWLTSNDWYSAIAAEFCIRFDRPVLKTTPENYYLRRVPVYDVEMDTWPYMPAEDAGRGWRCPMAAIGERLEAAQLESELNNQDIKTTHQYD
ncbi:hypothetical protein Tco_1018230 [Tanacetum coccineum]|uniref:Uncharacterized protein n=1 Tax=Tanacetum coccineum TaxID=301880 RepID=A0ABQ5FV57_9ASTR